jgi:hypothetical protein
MARLPIPGSDDGDWGNILNDYLTVEHNADGTLKASGSLATKQPLNGDLTAIAALSPTNNDVLQRKSGAWTNRTPAQLVADLGLTKSDVGLGNVDNTSDATKDSAVATLTNKTLTTPTIASFTNATHNHTNAAGGGQLTDAALSAAVTVPKGGTGAVSLTGLLLGNGVSAVTTVTAPAGTVVGATDTQTLTNKRVTPRITTVTSSATPTPNGDTSDMFTVTAQAATATFAAPTGTPTDGQSLIIRIKDDGTARLLNWNAIYRAIGVTLPTTTVISKTLYIGFKYNAADTRWDALAVAQEA